MHNYNSLNRAHETAHVQENRARAQSPAPLMGPAPRNNYEKNLEKIFFVSFFKDLHILTAEFKSGLNFQ